MKIISNVMKCALVIALVFGLQACSDDDDNNGGVVMIDPQDIVDIASGNSEFTTLVAALQRAGLVTTLQGPGPFTVLAPTNAAFDAFIAANDDFDSLDDIPTPVLTEVLLNHVIAGDISSAALAGEGSGYRSTQATGAGGLNMSIYFDTTDGDVRFNGVASVTDDGADVDASNGTIHIIDGVIGLPTIVTHATANSNFSSLVGALTADGNTTFTDLLSSDGSYTVFAPVNSAFDAFTNPNENDINNVLSNHVIAGEAIAAADLLGEGAGFRTTLGTGPMDAAMPAETTNLSLYFNTDDGVKLNGGPAVAVADVVASNGIVHAVDAVIDIPTVVTFALANPSFSSLVAALTADGQPDFVSTLSTPNGTMPAPFTVFAPVDAAFQALLDSNDDWDSLADIDSALLTAVLQHHVVAGANIVSGNLSDGAMPTMLNEQMITINLPGTGDNIADVTDASGASDIGIVGVDVQAGNGVIHVLNKVMIPALD